MANVHDRKLGGLFRGLFVGESGTGKTIAAGSFPGPILFYDFEDRIEPLRKFYPDRTDMEYKVVVGEDPRQRRDAIGLVEFADEWDKLSVRCDYETVVIDSFTSLSNCCIQFNVEKNPRPKLSPSGMSLPNWDEYKAETQLAADLCESLKNLPCHVIFTAHPVKKLMMEKPGDLESMRQYRSIVAHGTKTASFVPNYFNEMWYFYTDSVTQLGQTPRRFVCTAQTGDILAKTALPLETVFEITNQPLYKIVEKKLAEFDVKLETKRKQKGAALLPPTVVA